MKRQGLGIAFPEDEAGPVEIWCDINTREVHTVIGAPKPDYVIAWLDTLKRMEIKYSRELEEQWLAIMAENNASPGH